VRRNTSINYQTRIKIINFGFLAAALILTAKLFYIQVYKHEKYRTLAEGQHWIIQEIPAERGTIYSKDGAVLASNQDYYLLYAEPQRIEKKYEVADTLAQLLSEKDFGTYEELFAKYSKFLERELLWIALERNIDPLLKKQIEEMELKHIGFELAPIRYYPEENMASHVLGFVAFNEEGERVGYFGVEGSLNGDLRGKPGKVVQEKDAEGNPILVGGYDQTPPIKGRDIVLTIERSPQYIVEKKLKEAVEKYGAQSGSVIVMNPSTAEIIAMANYPEFNPSNLESESEAKNMAISDTYEPGSVLKAFTVSAGIDSGKISPSTTFVDSGPVVYSGYTIDNWDYKHHGVQTIAQLLQKSNNIGAAWVGHQVGSKDLYNYLTDFGLGEKSGISLEGEDTGIVRDYSTWTDIDLANVSFGQGVSATPLQVLNGFNAIANGGVLNRPRVISQVVTEDEKINMGTKKIRRVISKASSKKMTDLLVSAVDEGESKFSNLDGYRIAGKTGTAQIPEEGTYDSPETNATFAGFLAESKKFSMLVRLERPSTSPYASETAVPLWMDLARELATYYSIPPDKKL
jgi:cell division protein FtsI (penicillin-binding protein 3)